MSSGLTIVAPVVRRSTNLGSLLESSRRENDQEHPRKPGLPARPATHRDTGLVLVAPDEPWSRLTSTSKEMVR
jgi:hypothetical protein